MSKFDKETSCRVFCIHVKVGDIESRAQEMIRVVSDQSWISKLDATGQAAFTAMAQKTIDRLVRKVLTQVNLPVSKNFGEYLISYSAQGVLETNHFHKRLPLAELLKEKVVGNPGFDFHTESPMNHIMYGEAKYSGKHTPRKKAVDQINKFILDKKDDAELNVLRNFVSDTARQKALESKKGFVAAFSLNSTNAKVVFKKALKCKSIDSLLLFPELYLIAIEI